MSRAADSRREEVGMIRLWRLLPALVLALVLVRPAGVAAFDEQVVMHGQGVGFELFDELKVGQTDFVQRINYTRALQGELSRTIDEFPEVEKTRVHLVLPQKSLFIEEQKKASASVVLTLRRGQKLNAKQLQGIVNLVSMAILAVCALLGWIFLKNVIDPTTVALVVICLMSLGPGWEIGRASCRERV